MLKLTLTGEPQSTNNIYRSTCRGKYASVYMTKEGKTIKDSYGWQAREQIGRRTEYPLSGSLKIAIRLVFGTKRMGDIDNFSKLLYDSLTGIVWMDDSQIIEATISKHYEKGKGRIELIIEEI